MLTRGLLILCLVTIGAPYSEDASEDAASLRAKGPAALDGLLTRRDALVARRAEASGEAGLALNRELAALDGLIDQVGAQKGASVSRLWWYTDFDEALAASRESGKPILSLRMLGKLTDDLSCANSRFFRAILYSNKRISKLMRDRFVLHWASVREVPTVTVDFGDGRKLLRTVTGNSIHYVLDSRGRVVDGLPGLHGPAQFHEWLTRTADMGVVLSKMPDAPAARDVIVRYHAASLEELDRRWQADLRGIAIPSAAALRTPLTPTNPPAETAARLAHSKRMAERPMLTSIAMPMAQLPAGSPGDVWSRIGALRAGKVNFDAQSIAFIDSLNPLAGHSDSSAGALARMLSGLRRSVAIDEARNEYELHRSIHQWFVASPVTPALERLNDRVYDELFLTPRRDPWLGLLTDGVFTGLEDNGVVREG